MRTTALPRGSLPAAGPSKVILRNLDTQKIRSTYIILGFAVLLLIASFAAWNSTIIYLFNSLSCFLFCLVCLRFSQHLGRQYFCLNVIMIGQLIQLGFLISFGVLGIPPVIWNSEFYLDMRELPAITVFPYLIPCASALIVAIIGRRTFRRSPIDYFTAFAGHSRALVLIFAVSPILLFSIVLSDRLPSTLAYFLRTAAFTSNFLCFFAGYYAVSFRIVRAIWVIALGVNAIVFALIGGRFQAFFPIATFGLGYYLASGRLGRKRMWWLAVIAFLPSMFFLGLLGAVRGESGRDDVNMISVTQARRISSNIGGFLQSNIEDTVNEVFLQSFGRMIAWANPVVTAYTPSTIPFRGYSDLGNEIRASSQLYFFSANLDDYQNAELGTLRARQYGFTVNEATSVEFGILADGWNRGGILGACLYSLLFCGILALLEAAATSNRWLAPASRMVLVAVCMSLAWVFNATPFVHTVRYLILAICLWACTLIAVQPLLSNSGNRN